MDVTVVVATFGDPSWPALAASRAVPSAEALDVPVIAVHGASLHEARNEGISRVDTEWCCLLDADDELEAGYFDALDEADADLRAPAVRYIENGRAAPPRVPKVAGHTHDCSGDCLPYGNWLVIGTVARTELLADMGGFRDYPWSEDWDLWLRCWQAGATIEAVPQAIYRAHVRRDSRNRGPDQAAKLDAHRAIARANGVPVPA